MDNTNPCIFKVSYVNRMIVDQHSVIQWKAPINFISFDRDIDSNPMIGPTLSANVFAGLDRMNYL